MTTPTASRWPAFGIQGLTIDPGAPPASSPDRPSRSTRSGTSTLTGTSTEFASASSRDAGSTGGKPSYLKTDECHGGRGFVEIMLCGDPFEWRASFLHAQTGRM